MIVTLLTVPYSGCYSKCFKVKKWSIDAIDAVIQPIIAVVSPARKALTALITLKIKVRNTKCFFIVFILDIYNMFSSDNIFVMILGILISLGFIGGSVYWVNKLFIKNTKDQLVRFVLIIFTSLVALFIVDKTLAFKVSLLKDGMDSELFDLIKTLTLMIFSYYFGTKNSETTDKDKEE